MAAILHELINISPTKIQLMNVKIKDIKTNPLNDIYEIADIDQLAQSISESGLLSPLTVVKKDGCYKLIGGERRFTAIKQLGWTEVSCYILDKEEMTDEDEQLLLVSSNITRNMSVEDKVKITSKVEEIYNRKKELGEVWGIKKRDYIAQITGYGVRSVQDYLTKIHGKNEPTMLDIQKFVKYEKLHVLTVSEIEQRLMRMGQQHHGACGGMVDFACDPKGIVINNKDKITWKRCLKLIKQYVPLPAEIEKEPEEQIPGQLSMEEIYPEASGREVREAIQEDRIDVAAEEYEDLHHELKQIMYGYYPRVSHKEATRIIADIERLLRKRGLV